LIRLIRKLAIVFVVCGALSVVAAYFLAPPLAKTSLKNYAWITYGLELQISTVTVNPFTLVVELLDVHLADHEQTTLFHSPSVYANFNVADLFRQPLTVNEIRLIRPQLNLVYSGTDGPGPVRALVGFINTKMEAPPLPIHTINLWEGEIQITGELPTETVTTFNQINFQAKYLAWNQGASEYSLTFNQLNGGGFRFRGRFNLPDLSGSGEFFVDDLTPVTLSYWVDMIPSLDQASGRINVMGEYTVSTGDAGSLLAITDSRLDISAFGLHSAAQSTLAVKEAAIGFDASLAFGNDPIEVAISNVSARFDEITFSDANAVDTVSRVQISGASINPEDRSVDIAEMRVSGGSLSVRANPGNRLVRHGPITSVLHAVTRPPQDWTNWRFTLNEFNTEDLELSLIDITEDVPLEYRFSEIALLVRNISSAPDQRVDFDAGMFINRSGRLTANGWLDLHARSLQASVAVDALELVSFAPYLEHITPLTLVSALGSADVHLSIKEDAASIDGRLDIDDIRLARDDGEPALSLSSITVSGVALKTLPLHASIKNIRLDDLHMDVEQSSTGSLNLSDWINPGRSSLPRETQQLPASQGLPLIIDQVQVTGASVNFTDRSLIPALTLRANAITGDINSLHLSAGTSPFVLRMSAYQPAEFIFTGQLNESGGINMSGRAWQTHTGLTRQVSLELNYMNAVQLSPYTGRHLGREIESGRFNIDLDYLVNSNVITGHHRVHFDRLQLGRETGASREKIPSLQLALALLQDEHDQINLTNPISGKIEEAGLAIHIIAARAFTEKLTTIFDNSFELLADIAGVTDKPLNAVPFEPGSAGISPVAAQILNGLSEALRQRPGLALRIAGGYDPGIDRDALALQQIRLHVTLAAASASPPGGTVTPLNLSDPRIQEVLDEFAEERLGREQLAKIDHAGAGTPRFYQAVFDALVGEEEISVSALESLAKYRLQSIMAELVKSGVTEDRLIITDPLGTGISDDRQVLVKLDLAPL